MDKRHEVEGTVKTKDCMSWAWEHSSARTSCTIDLKFDMEQLSIYVDKGRIVTGSSQHKKKFKFFVTFVETAQKIEIPVGNL